MKKIILLGTLVLISFAELFSGALFMQMEVDGKITSGEFAGLFIGVNFIAYLMVIGLLLLALMHKNGIKGFFQNLKEDRTQKKELAYARNNRS